MKKVLAPAVALLLLSPGVVRGDDPPALEHQAALCTVPGEAPLALRRHQRRRQRGHGAALLPARRRRLLRLREHGLHRRELLRHAARPAGEDEGDRVLRAGGRRQLPADAHEHLPPPRAARGRLRVPARREGPGEERPPSGSWPRTASRGRSSTTASTRPASRLSRFRSVSVLALGLLATGAAARAEAVLDVSGSVISVAPRLEVRVVVTNRGDRTAVPARGRGRAPRRAAHGPARRRRVAPGGEGAVVLAFAPSSARPGTHALTLLLEHPVEGLARRRRQPADGQPAGVAAARARGEPGPGRATGRGRAPLRREGRSRGAPRERRRRGPPRAPPRAHRAGTAGGRRRHRGRRPREGHVPGRALRSCGPAPRAAADTRCSSSPRPSTAPSRAPPSSPSRWTSPRTPR